VNVDEAMARLAQHSATMNPQRAKVLLALLLAAGDEESIDLPMDYLAVMTGISTRRIREHLSALEYHGFLETERTPRYRIMWPERIDEGDDA
jgi:predicted ArsR family transcriptional regulator